MHVVECELQQKSEICWCRLRTRTHDPLITKNGG